MSKRSKKVPVINGCKQCTKCLITKPLSDYHTTTKPNKIIYSSRCKLCIAEYKLEYAEKNKGKLKIKGQEYREKHREEANIKSKKYYQDNTEKVKQYHKELYDADPEKYREKGKQYYYDNKEAAIERSRVLSNKKYKEDPAFKLRNRVSSEVKRALKKVNSSKNGHSILEYLPYTIEELKQYIEGLFVHQDNLTPDGKTWMTWKNWGKYDALSWDDNDSTTWKWNLDHIIPQADLIYTDMKDDNFQACWKLDNLRPLSAKQNILDGVNRVRHKNGR